MNEPLTSREPVFIDSESVPADLSGTISVDLPHVFPDVSPNEIAHLRRRDFSKAELKGKCLVSIHIVRYSDSIKGNIPTTTLIDGGSCYLTAAGVKQLRKSGRNKSYFKWVIHSEEK